MLNIPVLRWGRPYTSLEVDNVIHFSTGETLAKVSQANPGLLAKDIRQAQRARDVLCEIAVRDLIGMMKKAGELYRDATLPMGDCVQSPADFARQQSASTGLPEHMCKANMAKNHFVLSNMDRILDCLTRGLDLEILSRGYGTESRGVIVSYQAQSPVLGLVLPSNSPGVHTLWLPVIPMQIGLVLKPGPQEPWTPYRMAAAFCEAGVPREDPTAGLAAFTVPGQAQAIHASIQEKIKESGAEDMTAKFGPRLVEQERCAYLRPWVIHSQSPDAKIANTEYMFPYVTVVQCPQEQMIEKIGPTLVAYVITNDRKWERQLTDATNIDRLNLGSIPTTKLDWLQPHEGNIVDFLFRARAFQIPPERLAGAA